MDKGTAKHRGRRRGGRREPSPRLRGRRRRTTTRPPRPFAASDFAGAGAGPGPQSSLHHRSSKRFAYATAVASDTVDLRAVATLRSKVFEKEYDKVISMPEGAHKSRILATVEWDRLERATEEGGIVCIGAWLGDLERCDPKVLEAILAETDRSTLRGARHPIIGSLDVGFKRSMPADVLRLGEDLGIASAAYVSNVGVLSSARCCGVAGALLDHAEAEAAARGADYLFTHAHKSHDQNLLYFKHAFVVQEEEEDEKKDTVLLGKPIDV